MKVKFRWFFEDDEYEENDPDRPFYDGVLKGEFVICDCCGSEFPLNEVEIRYE